MRFPTISQRSVFLTTYRTSTPALSKAPYTRAKNFIPKRDFFCQKTKLFGKCSPPRVQGLKDILELVEKFHLVQEGRPTDFEALKSGKRVSRGTIGIQHRSGFQLRNRLTLGKVKLMPIL